jgi:hypothetical protein
MVIVRVGEEDGQDLPAADLIDDRGCVVRGIDDHAFVIVAHDPDVVLHVPGAAVE